MLIVPKTIEAPQLMLNRHKELFFENRVLIEGLIGWELIRNGKVIRWSRPQRNLIVNSGLDGMGTTLSTNLVAYCGVGSSSVAPAATDTALVAQVGSRTNSNGGFGDTNTSGPSYDYWEFSRTRVFVEAEANGNLTEVGFFSASTAGTMFNRQLLVDNLGNPTTITKTAEDQLRITFKFRTYANKTTINQTINISGVSTDIQNRCVDVSNWGGEFGGWAVRATAFENNALPAVTGLQTGTNADGTNTLQAYGTGNHYRDLQVVFAPAQANFTTGIGSLEWGPSASGFSFLFISTFTPKIAKTSTYRLTLMARSSWAIHP